MSEFNSAKADFGTELAISTRAELNPGIELINVMLCRVFNSR